MLAYRHEFHAGNHADLLKHFVLTRSLAHLVRKEKGLRYVDTHAGAGSYPWTSERSETTGERDRGAGRILDRDDSPEELAPLLGMLRRGRDLGVYPGSPALAAELLRPQDQLFLYELHTTDYGVLSARFSGDRRVHAERSDGFSALRAVLPPPSRRGLVLIDPSYELAEDYDKVAAALAEGIARFPTGCFLVWYPLLDRNEARALPERLLSATGAPALRAELRVRVDRRGERGLFGSGMIVFHPPWALGDGLRSVLPYLARTVAEEEGTGSWSLEETGT